MMKRNWFNSKIWSHILFSSFFRNFKTATILASLKYKAKFKFHISKTFILQILNTKLKICKQNFCGVIWKTICQINWLASANMYETCHQKCNSWIYIHPCAFALNLELGLYFGVIIGLRSAFVSCILIGVRGGNLCWKLKTLGKKTSRKSYF